MRKFKFCVSPLVKQYPEVDFIIKDLPKVRQMLKMLRDQTLARVIPFFLIFKTDFI